MWKVKDGPSELFFVVLNFVTVTQSSGTAWHCINDIIDIHAYSILLAIFLVTRWVCRDLDKYHEIEY